MMEAGMLEVEHEKPLTATSSPCGIRMVDRLNTLYEQIYSTKFLTESALNRRLVSFQASKSRAVYRWYKYKEAFSAELVEFLLQKYGVHSGTLLDPFAGSGTALFASSSFGLSAVGIELLLIGQWIINTKNLIDKGISENDIETLTRWIQQHPWRLTHQATPLPELRITKGAYPHDTACAISRYLAAASVENENTRTILTFALLCILESVSYTRKDGQYLRWDYRSGRRQGEKKFDKGEIPSFDKAMCAKLREIVRDLMARDLPLDLFSKKSKCGSITLHFGSCLEILPQFPAGSFDCIMTSPPYCNRYDYTRTYALELAILGIDENGLSRLRQQMLSCTVENKAKDLLTLNPSWRKAISVADEQELLRAILIYLEGQRDAGELNNNGIPRMVRGYFYEMTCVIAECARVLKPNAYLMMVNDNVRYAGASISVDVILSDIAANMGFSVKNILVLPNGKGNSSQQMGRHGRNPLRKCVYVWRRC